MTAGTIGFEKRRWCGMTDSMIFMFNALENIALAVCISIAAMHFENPKLLWFYILIVLNGVSIKHKKEEDQDEVQ